METDAAESVRRARGIARAAELIGIAGAVLSLILAAVVSASVLGRWLLDQGVPGDFEFIQMFTAVSVFFFLPACQAKRGNILVDTFTGFLSKAACARIDMVWDFVYGIVMGVLGYCMILGTYEAWKTNTGTMVLQFPTWPALAISTALLFFLSFVCFWTARGNGGHSS